MYTVECFSETGNSQSLVKTGQSLLKSDDQSLMKQTEFMLEADIRRRKDRSLQGNIV